MFETFSFLPPLSDAEISKQVQYLLNNGWTPCIEFEDCRARLHRWPRLGEHGLLHQRRLLRQPLLGYVEAPHVRLPKPG